MDTNTPEKTSQWIGGKSNTETDRASARPNDLFREFALAWLLVNLIDDAPRRVRRGLQCQDAAVMHGIERFGFRIPMLVRSKPGGERYEVIDGHSRLAAARMLGAEALPCIVVDDLPEVELRRLTLSLNKLQETGVWDQEALHLEINEIIQIDGDLEIPGFELPAIEAIRFGDRETGKADSADDLSGLDLRDNLPVSKSGDLWRLGDHKVLCGSARDATAVAALHDGEIADAIFTDAPFNVPITGHVSTVRGRHPEFAEASGEMSREEFVAFLAETLGNASACLKPGGVLFGCMDWRHVSEMNEALHAIGLQLLNICVWVKSAPGMGNLYRSQHEFVFVARRSGNGHRNNVQLGKFGRNRSNVWHYAGATGGARDPDDDFNAHPTVKPICMVMDALLDVTVPGDLVCDPFLGSGTTLLAAERTRRRCVAVEIEPRYVDLAIRRWQPMTGGLAIHAETGATFDEMEAMVAGVAGSTDEDTPTCSNTGNGEDV